MKLHHLPLLAAILVSGPDATAAPAFPTHKAGPHRRAAPGGLHHGDVRPHAHAREMSTLLGQPIVIESRPGAAGTIGARDVALSKPDGYTGLMNASIQVMYPGIFKTLHFDPIKDFTPVGVFGFAPMVAVVRSPLRSRASAG